MPASKNPLSTVQISNSARCVLSSIDEENAKAAEIERRNKFIKARIPVGRGNNLKIAERGRQLAKATTNCRVKDDGETCGEVVMNDQFTLRVSPSGPTPRRALAMKSRNVGAMYKGSDKKSVENVSVESKCEVEVGQKKNIDPKMKPTSFSAPTVKKTLLTDLMMKPNLLTDPTVKPTLLTDPIVTLTPLIDSNTTKNPSIPSGLMDLIKSSIPAESPDVEWDDVIGLSELKRSLLTSVVVSQRRVKLFVGLRKPKKSFLLYGPPGTGKTLIVKAIAKASGFVFFNVLPSIVTSKFRGESEKLISSLFEMAKSYEKAIIFFDEIDSLAMKRGGQSEHEASRRFMSEFLVRLQECSETHNNIYIFAATNRPWDIDSAVLRRFQVKSYVPLPTKEDRCLILKRLLVEHTLMSNFDFDKISGYLDGYSPSDIRNICSSAANYPLDDYLGGFNDSALNRSSFLDVSVDLPIGETHFLKAIGTTPKSVTKDELKEFEKYMEQ
uniref:AAA domain-containing protein n=1 Tax=Rhabditophanes sp. KR3021 TaxID=114890 RepID=A0AC35TPR6_9BILA